MLDGRGEKKGEKLNRLIVDVSDEIMRILGV